MCARFLLTTVGVLLTLAAASADPPTDKKPSDPARYEARLDAAQLITDPYDKSIALIKIATEAAEDGRDEIVKKAMAALPKMLDFTMGDSQRTPSPYADLLKKLAEAGRSAEAMEAAKLIKDEQWRGYTFKRLAESDDAGPAAFWRACETGKDDRVTALLSTVSVNAKDKDGETGLMKAAANGHVAVVKLLLAQPKVELWETDAKGQTALMKAAANGQDAVVRLILMSYDKFTKKYPKDDPVNLADAKGQTALMQAAAKGGASVVQTLLDIKAYDSTLDHERYLTFEGNGHPIADEARTDNDGKTAQELAEAGQHTGAADLLKKARRKAG